MGEAILSLIKIVLTIVLFPFVYIFATRFHQHLSVYPHNSQEFFLFGVLAYLLVYLFIYTFEGVHQAGQKLMRGVVSFARPMDDFLANIFPFYPIVVMLLFYATRNFLSINDWNQHFLFFAGFALSMHVLLVAHEMQNRKKGVFRPEYFFEITLVFLINILVMILLFDLVFEKLTILKFFHNNFFDVKSIYQEAYQVMTVGRI